MTSFTIIPISISVFVGFPKVLILYNHKSLFYQSCKVILLYSVIKVFFVDEEKDIDKAKTKLTSSTRFSITIPVFVRFWKVLIV